MGVGNATIIGFRTVFMRNGELDAATAAFGVNKRNVDELNAVFSRTIRTTGPSPIVAELTEQEYGQRARDAVKTEGLTTVAALIAQHTKQSGLFCELAYPVALRSVAMDVRGGVLEAGVPRDFMAKRHPDIEEAQNFFDGLLQHDPQVADQIGGSFALGVLLRTLKQGPSYLMKVGR